MPSLFADLGSTNKHDFAKIPRIDELASIISSSTSKVSHYLRDNKKPYPSFSADGPVSLDIQSPEVELSRFKAIDALQELLDLLQGPIACMTPYHFPTDLQIIHRHDLARKVPMDGTVSFEELSKKCGLHACDLKRVIRYSIAYHRLFTEPKPGYVAHSAGSKLLVKDEIFRAGFGLEFNDFYPSMARTADALDKWQDQEPNHTGFTLAHDTEDAIFDYMRNNSERTEQFAKAMQCFSQNVPGSSSSFLVKGYDWNSLGSVTVIDIGGSDGYASIALAKAHPNLNLIVQDLPDVVEAANRQTLDADIKRRLRFQGHDFFKPQPETADVYLYRWVFHDWPDHYVVRALKNLVPVLKEGARVVVNESLSPEPGTLPLTMERVVTFMDLLMLTANNSRLRTMDEWNQIFQMADTRFGPVTGSLPEGSSMAILESIWTG